MHITKKIAHKKTGKNFGFEGKLIYSEVMSLCLFSLQGRVFSSKTETDDENVDEKRYEMHGLVEF